MNTCPVCENDNFRCQCPTKEDLNIDEVKCDCSHTVKGNYNTVFISGNKVGLKHLSFTVCNRCNYILNDKTHPEHSNIKVLIRKSAQGNH